MEISTLIVDDDRDFAESMGDILELHNHTVDFAFSGEEAMCKFREKEFDVTFIDVNLPGKNGLETYLDIHKLKPAARVVMMSGFDVDELLNESIDNGALAVLHKPFKMGQILELLPGMEPRPTLLIADDDSDFVDSFKEVLSGCGYSILSASNGWETVEQARSNEIDLLVLDLRLPGLDGLQIYSELMRTGVYLPTLILSAYIDEEAAKVKTLQSMSVEGIFSKPFDPAELRQAIHDIIKRKKAYTYEVPDTGKGAGTGGKRPVLIVEEDRDFAESMSDLLSGRGYEVKIAHKGSDALRLIQGSDIKVVLIDIGLKYSEEGNLISKLHELKPDVICVTMGSHSSSDNTMDALFEGAYGCMYKPFNIRELLLTLERCFEKVSLEAKQEALEKTLIYRHLELNRVYDGLNLLDRSLKKVALHHDPDKTGRVFFETLARNLNAGGGSIFLREGERFVLVHSLDPAHTPPALSCPAGEDTVIGLAVKRRSPLFIKDITRDKQAKPSGWNGYKDHSLLVFPVLNEAGRVVWLMTLHNKKTPGFTRTDLMLGTILCSFFGCMICKESQEKRTPPSFPTGPGGNIFHELYQPLSSIGLYVASLQNMAAKSETVDSGYLLKSLGKILKQVDRTTHMIDRIKNF